MAKTEKSDWHKLLFFIFKKWKINTAIFLILFFITIILVFFVMEKKYTAEVSVLPPISGGVQELSGALGNIASLAGIDLGKMSFQSPMMYAGILKSRRLLEKVCYHKYMLQNKQINLIEFLDMKGKSKEELLQKALKQVREDALHIDIDSDNMIMYLSVT
ncbi:MAG: Wzz/FepE/Etk N-terminal domain-containing protein, partial [Promethearchaeota archaeon]